MEKILVFIFGYFMFLQSCSLSVVNDRPIIGIVTEELFAPTKFAPNATSYIMASYVKYLESSGARVIPIMNWKPKSYYEDLLSKINGVLFPGGGVDLQGDGYARTGRIIFDIAVKMNDKGHYFPLWGTCLGFELLNVVVANKSWMKACAAEDLPSNINFVQDFKDGRMFKDLDNTLKNIMETQNITINYHQWCLTPLNYSASHLNKFFNMLATSKDSNGLTHIAIIEAYNYPFYAVSFHPEKVLFEWVLSKTHHNIPHSANAVRVSQYFSQFFVNEARKSSHHFPSIEAENAVLIYNYNPVFTGKQKNYATVQKYFFL